MNSNRYDVIENSTKIKELALEGIFDGNILFYQRNTIKNSLQYIAAILNPTLLSRLLEMKNSRDKPAYAIKSSTKFLITER